MKSKSTKKPKPRHKLPPVSERDRHVINVYLLSQLEAAESTVSAVRTAVRHTPTDTAAALLRYWENYVSTVKSLIKINAQRRGA